MKGALRLLYPLPFLLLIGAGDCGGPEAEKPPEAQGGGGGARSEGGSGGGAETPEAPKESKNQSLEERYRRGQDLLKRKQHDEAADELQAVAAQEAGSPLGVKAAAERRQALAELAKLPPSPASKLAEFRGRKASARGAFRSAGRAGQNESYFWLVDGDAKVQCLYGKLPTDDRQSVAAAAEGAKILVRGTVVAPTAGGGGAALDLSLFKKE